MLAWRRWSIVPLLLVSSSALAQATGVRILLAAWPEPVLLDTLKRDYDVEAAPGRTYGAVLTAMPDLGIPVGRWDSKAGIVGSERFERMRAVGTIPMSRLFDCGASITGPNADAYRLEIAVVAWVTSAPRAGTSTLGLAAIASGRDVSGTSRGPKECVSTGILEAKLLERVRKLVTE